jgi:hypothetical protein
MADDFEHLYVEFFMDTIQNMRETAEQGRPIFNNVEYVKVRIAGDKGTVHVAPAHEKAYAVREGVMGVTHRVSYAEMYPEQYKAFKAGLSQAVTGTPIDEAPFLTMANRAELKGVNVFTIEALAGLEKTDKLGMNGDRMREQARAYLKRAEGSAIDGKLLADNEALKADLEVMKAQMAQLLAKKGKEDADEPSEASAEEVDKPGPFFGYTAKMLREFIKDKTEQPVKGNPKLATLLSMAEEALEIAA